MLTLVLQKWYCRIIIIIISHLILSQCQKQPVLPELEIHPRNDWNQTKTFKASHNKLYSYKYSLNSVLDIIIIHHSAFFDQPGPEFIKEYQMIRQGFDDIAYHYIIGEDGEIYEGRPIEYMGAHAGQTKEANELANKIRAGLIDANLEQALRLDPDYGSIGICLDGHFEYDEPKEEQLHSLKILIRYLLEKYDIKPYNILMHNEVNEKIIMNAGLTPIGEETVCPGRVGTVIIKERLVNMNSQ